MDSHNTQTQQIMGGSFQRRIVHKLFLVIVIINVEHPEASPACPGRNLFGPSCQYLCHCSNNCSASCLDGVCSCYHDNCDVNGECVDGVSCQSGWFGPACQYGNLLQEGFYQLSGDATDSSVYHLIWAEPFLYSWLRVQLCHPEISFNASLRFTSNKYRPLVCRHPRLVTLTGSYLDFFCDIWTPVRAVVIPKTWLDFNCSVYVSGGRNVALMEGMSPTNQSDAHVSNHSNQTPGVSLADGSHDSSICSDTPGRILSPTWNVTFSQPRRVIRYVIHSALLSDSRKGSDRHSGLSLTAYSVDYRTLTSYQGTMAPTQTVHSVISTSGPTPVASVHISTTRNELLLCQVDIYGESSCPEFWFGRDCEHHCRCGGECLNYTEQCLHGCHSEDANDGDHDDCQEPSEMAADFGLPLACVDNCGSIGEGVSGQSNSSLHLSRNCSHGCMPGWASVNSSLNEHVLDVWNHTNYLTDQDNCSLPTLELAVSQLQQLKDNPGKLPDNTSAVLTQLSHRLSYSLNVSESLSSREIQQVVAIFRDVGWILQQNKNMSVENLALENFASAADRILAVPLQNWTEAVRNEDVDGPTLLVAMDAIVGASLHQVLDNITSYYVKDNLVIKRANTNQDIHFSGADNDSRFMESSSTVLLRREAFLHLKERMSYAIILYPKASLRMNLSLASNLNHQSLSTKVVNSDIVSLSLHPQIPTISPPLELWFSLSQSNYSQPVCAYLAGELGQSIRWSSEGCSTTLQGGRVHCSCNHLTNFAILMSPFENKTPVHNRVLRLISVIGGAISILCLLMTLVIYWLLWKYVKSERTTLHVHLCVSLTIAYCVFLAGVDKTHHYLTCRLVAILLHFLYLVVFCLLLSEGFLMLQAVGFVTSSRSILRYLVPFCYGTPVTIVSISVGATTTQGYGSRTSCWLSTSEGLIWAFMAPVLFMILLNFLILVYVLNVMMTRKLMQNKTERQRILSVVRTVCVLSPILGITWIFGVLSVNKDTVVFQYIFAVLNSLQGMMILICNCLLTPQVQEGLRATRRRHSSVLVNTAWSLRRLGGYSYDVKTPDSDISRTELSKYRRRCSLERSCP